jgi:hypothetical protein
MTTIPQVIAQIRFQLDQLSSKNAHHDFEHLCRHLARASICSNIIPATGPVSTGGDQGRDFETFKTYLDSSSIAQSVFVGKISKKPLAFPCTLQRERINSKIKSDIVIIMNSGTTIEGIHYFCVADIPISNRHNLQAWAKEQYSIDLEVYDGQAISELLANPEVFWIAEQYLEIPNEIFPRKIEGDNWYTKTLKTWKLEEKPMLNYAAFNEIKLATREATHSPALKVDLNFWIEALGWFKNKNFPTELQRRATYEISVAQLRGLGTLLGQEDSLRKYFSVISSLDNPVEIEDAAVLMNYCSGASLLNKVNLKSEEISQWQNAIKQRVEEKIKMAENIGLKCSLIEIRGYLALTINPVHPKMPDVDDALIWWSQLVILLKETPFFPLERFADRLTEFIGIIETEDKFDDLTQQIDLLLAKKHGDFIAAEKCRDRAIKFFDKGKILKGINQLHQAKVKWFAEETLQGSLLSMLLISQWYLELGLSFAAKYYALAVVFIAFNSLREELKSFSSRALINAAECDYHQGCWCGFLELTEIGLNAHGLFAKDAGDFEKHHELQSTVFHAAVILTIMKRLDQGLFEFTEGSINNWPVKDWIKALLEDANKAWQGYDMPSLWSMIESQLAGRPFSDVGPEREVSWLELGVTWRVRWANNYITTPSAEQFIAILQILLADLTKIDLSLLKTEVNIHLVVGQIDTIKIESLPSNEKRRWKLIIPSADKTDDKVALEQLQIKIVTVAITILTEISLLKKEQLDKILQEAFKNGLTMKAFVAKPYEILYRGFINQEAFKSSDRAGKCIPESFRNFNLREHKELEWYGGSGIGYSKKNAHTQLQNRYKRLIIPIKYTLQRLLAGEQTRENMKLLRNEGWKDWHILASIFSITINYRVNGILAGSHDPEKMQRLFLKMMNEPEAEKSEIIPEQEFSLNKMRDAQRMNMLATIKVFGLESHQLTPDLIAIDHFLSHRYNYWTDDIEHNKILD